MSLRYCQRQKCNSPNYFHPKEEKLYETINGANFSYEKMILFENSR
jgi:hypothetical protein